MSVEVACPLAGTATGLVEKLVVGPAGLTDAERFTDPENEFIDVTVMVDCADPQCTAFPACLVVSCTADVDFGTIAQHGASVSRQCDTTGGSTAYATCAPDRGFGRVGRFQLDATSDVRMDFKQGTTSAHAIALFRAGANQACDRNPVDCTNAMDNPTATKERRDLVLGLMAQQGYITDAIQFQAAPLTVDKPTQAPARCGLLPLPALSIG